jgi:hypothetical protein
MVAYEDDLLGSTAELGYAELPTTPNALKFSDLIVHLKGERRFYMSRREVSRVRSSYGDPVFRAVVTSKHMAQSAVMEP